MSKRVHKPVDSVDKWEIQADASRSTCGKACGYCG